MELLRIEIDDACKGEPIAENETDQLYWCPHQRVLFMLAKATGKALVMNQVTDAEVSAYLESFHALSDARLAAINLPPIH